MNVCYTHPLKILHCPVAVMGGVVVVAFTALAAALSSEAFLGLEPCELCIYQRWPYLIVMVVGFLGLGLKNKIKLALPVALALSALAFFINSGIALYHTGVEQKWWVSAVDGCKVPNFGATPQNILDNIMSAPAARCDEIPWADPLFSLSMANYNVILCFALFLVCALAAYCALKPRQTCSPAP